MTALSRTWPASRTLGIDELNWVGYSADDHGEPFRTFTACLDATMIDMRAARDQILLNNGIANLHFVKALIDLGRDAIVCVLEANVVLLSVNVGFENGSAVYVRTIQTPFLLLHATSAINGGNKHHH